jgi:hypothetical protein
MIRLNHFERHEHRRGTSESRLSDVSQKEDQSTFHPLMGISKFLRDTEQRRWHFAQYRR